MNTWPRFQDPSLEITLLHILSGLPPAFWDDGHILDDQEQEVRQRLVARWRTRKNNGSGLVLKATNRLKKAGLTSVHSPVPTRHFDVAEDIITEAAAMGVQTIVIGRRGLGTAQ